MILNKPPRESLVQYQLAVEKSESRNVNQFLNENKPGMDEVIEMILPAREWYQDNKIMSQQVSLQPASREDVANLQKLLDERLLARQARESGICPIREELHEQCFNEIIRQVTIDQAERGLLLMRVRDELKMTISAYNTLYQSSVTFGTRKQLQSSIGKDDLVNKVADLQVQKQKLEDKKLELQNKKDVINKKIQDTKVKNEIKRKNEIEYLKYQSQHLEQFLKTLSADQK